MRIGLFGGSFNPPHAGHVLVTTTALRRLRLDKVWWLVTPGNPLKDNHALPPLAERMAACRNLLRDPRVAVTGIEASIGARYTLDTITWLRRRAPGVHFVWIMGADNLAGFHRWQGWRRIAGLVPIAVVDRPGATLKGVRNRAAAALAPWRLEESDAVLLPGHRPPAWIFLHGPRSVVSSTQLRKRAGKA
jgi:nicotinate-nucleotide adenylyltransferase